MKQALHITPEDVGLVCWFWLLIGVLIWWLL